MEGQRVLTMIMVKHFEKDVVERNSLRNLKFLLNAFRSAARIICSVIENHVHFL